MTQEISKPSLDALLSTSLKSSRRLLKEDRVFETEAETTILRAIVSNEQDESDHHEHQSLNDPASTRRNGRASMAQRASAVSKLPPVIEGASSTKTFGFTSDSSLTINAPPPKLRDIARRIKFIQKVSQERTSTNRHRMSILIEKQMHNDTSRPLPNRLASTKQLSPTNESMESLDETKHSNDLDNLPDSILDEARKTKSNASFWYSVSKCVNVFQGRKQALKNSFRVVCYIFIPFVGVASAMYYIAGNPIGFLGASYSWWILFVIRQCVTFIMARFSQFIAIDVIVLETKLALMMFGRVATLIAMQVRGWPTILLFWSVYNFSLLYGDRRIARHWGYRQSIFDIFSDKNPSGSVTSNPWYASFLLACLVTSFLTMVKRVLMAIFLGRKKYGTYGPKMEQIMMKVLLISEMSLLAEEIEDAASFNIQPVHQGGLGTQGGSCLIFSRMQSKLKLEDSKEDSFKSKNDHNGSSFKTSKSGDSIASNMFESQKRSSKWKSAFKKINPKSKRQHTSFVDSDIKVELEKLLEWDEPTTKQRVPWNDTSIRTILQFKETLHYMDTDHPLSVPFGPADTHKHCIESSERVFGRLMMRNPGSDKLKFETLLIVALNGDGTLDRVKAKALKRLFKPSRHGDISLLDFAKTCSDVYKRIRMFRAKTLNSAQLDDAFEQLINIVFYFSIVLLVLAILGVDPFNLIISMTGILVPLAFLFNDAGSEYFQGLLLILARQPYDIGDCISISDPTLDTKINGSQPWFVQGITLFTTTLRNGSSNEVASISNGALAKTRIINAARSPKAQIFVFLKFAIDVPYDKVKIFNTVIKEFVRDRPREWIQLSAFRALRVEADLGFIEYEVIAQHVESWQIIGQVLQSRADLSSFCLEVMKQMGMRYNSPSMPVNVTFQHEDHAGESNSNFNEGNDDLSEDTISGNKSQFSINDSKMKALTSLFRTASPKPSDTGLSDRSLLTKDGRD